MMLPIPRAGVLRAVGGQDAARAVPGITGLEITVPRGRRVVPLPEGDRYLGFLFARGDTPAAVEAVAPRRPPRSPSTSRGSDIRPVAWRCAHPPRRHLRARPAARRARRGRRPPAGEGHEVRAVDVSVDPWDPALGRLGRRGRRSRCRCTPPPASPATSLGASTSRSTPSASTPSSATTSPRPVAGHADLPAPRSAPATRPLRPPRDRRRAAARRLGASPPGLRAPVPSLPGAGGLRRPRPTASTRPRCSPTSRSSSRPARGTSRSATPTSSTRRRTRGESSPRCTSASPRHVRLHGEGRARPRGTPTSGRARRRRVRVRGVGVRVGRRRRARAPRQGPHHRRRRTRGRRAARRGHRGATVVAAVHAVDDAATTSSPCSTSCTSTTSSAASTRCSTACGCCSPRVRCCSTTPSSCPSSAPGTPSGSTLHVGAPDPARRRAAASSRRSSSERRRRSDDVVEIYARVRDAAGAPPVDLVRVTHRPPPPHRELVLLRRTHRAPTREPPAPGPHARTRPRVALHASRDQTRSAALYVRPRDRARVLVGSVAAEHVERGTGAEPGDVLVGHRVRRRDGLGRAVGVVEHDRRPGGRARGRRARRCRSVSSTRMRS